LFGAPESILADIRIERAGSATHDAFDLLFYYQGEVRAVLAASMLAPEPRPHYRIQGTDGVFVKHTLDPQETLLRAGHPVGGENWGVEPEKDWGTMTRWKSGQLEQQKIPTLRGDYRDFYAQVRDAILGNARAPVTAEEALGLMYALELCVESSRKRAPIPWKFEAAQSQAGIGR